MNEFSGSVVIPKKFNTKWKNSQFKYYKLINNTTQIKYSGMSEMVI